MKFSIACLFAAVAIVAGQETKSLKERLLEHRQDMFRDSQATLEAIKDNHVRRMAKLEEMIEERRQLVEGHESGRRRLSDEDYEKAARQHRNFQRKLEQMRNHNTDDYHREKLEELKSLHNMNRVDYVDLRDME